LLLTPLGNSTINLATGKYDRQTNFTHEDFEGRGMLDPYINTKLGKSIYLANDIYSVASGFYSLKGGINNLKTMVVNPAAFDARIYRMLQIISERPHLIALLADGRFSELESMIDVMKVSSEVFDKQGFIVKGCKK
jgi:hypothetical protein